MADAWYVEHFRHLLHTVAGRYAHLLPADDIDFVSRFEALPPDARHLYCRLITRRGPWFRRSRLEYADIGALDEAIDVLVQEALVSQAGHAAPDMLALCTRAELTDWFALPATLRKSQQLQRLQHADISPLLAHERWLHFDQGQRLKRLEVCYFGNRHQGVESFVIAELGHLRWEHYRLDQHHLHFPDAATLEASLQLMRLQDQLQDQLRGADVAQLQAWYAGLPAPTAVDPRRSRVLHDLARQAERLHAHDLAETWHREGQSPASRERLARLALRQGRHEEATAWLESLLGEGIDPALGEAAAQLLRRHGLGHPPQRFEPPTRRLLLDPGEHTVERRVAAHLTLDGGHCIHGENVLHRSLLGLLIWDILFADIPGAFSNPYQRAPLDFRDSGFALRRKTLIDARLSTPQAEWLDIMRDTFDRKHGITNALVHWEFLDSIDWEAAANALTTRVMRVIFVRLLQNIPDHGSGLPDLLWWNEEGNMRLIEVKAPGDVLQPHQRAWLQWLVRHDVPAEVLHVDYR